MTESKISLLKGTYENEFFNYRIIIKDTAPNPPILTGIFVAPKYTDDIIGEFDLTNIGIKFSGQNNQGDKVVAYGNVFFIAKSPKIYFVLHLTLTKGGETHELILKFNRVNENK